MTIILDNLTIKNALFFGAVQNDRMIVYENEKKIWKMTFHRITQIVTFSFTSNFMLGRFRFHHIISATSTTATVWFKNNLFCVEFKAEGGLLLWF